MRLRPRLAVSGRDGIFDPRDARDVRRSELSRYGRSRDPRVRSGRLTRRTRFAYRARVIRYVLLVALIACHSSSLGIPTDAGESADAPAIIHPDGPTADAAVAYRRLCDAPHPEGAPYPISPNPPVAGCPTLVPGMNTITSSGKSRQFLYVVPSGLQPDEYLPVMFMWYWLGGSAQDFLDQGEVQDAVDEQRFLAVIPVSEGADLLGTSWNLQWPFDITETQARMDEEFQFFDDALACVEEQANVNRDCVSTAGVSAGALFTDQLVQARSTTLSSFLSL